jgi:hypothetical protein
MATILAKIKEYAAVIAVLISIGGTFSSLVIAHSPAAQAASVREQIYSPAYREHLDMVAERAAEKEVEKLERRIDRLENKIDQLIQLHR